MTTPTNNGTPGEMSGTFSRPHPIRPGACPTCGTYPACEPPPKPKGKR